MPRFVLVRHGETYDNKTDHIQGWHSSKLTEKGIMQAEQIAPKLPVTPDIMFSSDLYRARQTARIIHASYDATPLLFDWRIRERSFGPLEGKTSSSVNWDEFFSVPEADSPLGAEPVRNFHERLKSFIRETESMNAKTILVVTHSGVLNNFGYILIDDFEHVEYENGTVVEYEIDYKNPRLAPKPVNKWSPIG